MSNKLLNHLQSVIMNIIIMLGLVACGKAIEHEPKAGEYGQLLVETKHLSDEKIALLNAEGAAKPWLKQTEDGEVDLYFKGYAEQSPYRFLIVIHGHALNKGEVEVQFLGGIEAASSNGFSPSLYYEEDTSNYFPNEPVLLIVSAEPFSINPASELNDFRARAWLSKRDNFQFERIELQVWQGKGDYQSSIVMYFFITIVLCVLLLAVRAATLRRR